VDSPSTRNRETAKKEGLVLMQRIVDFLERVKGLPILIGILLAILNFIVQYVPGLAFLSDNNLLLHLGVVVGLLGVLLTEAI
jgi:hypothetical protein